MTEDQSMYKNVNKPMKDTDFVDAVIHLYFSK